MPYLVLLIGDTYALRSVREMGFPAIDQKLFKTIFQGLSALKSAEWWSLLKGLSDDEPFSYLKLSQFVELAETALAPSPAQLTQDIDPDLRLFFEKLYSRPEMNDLVWLNTFRIQSSRCCQEKPFVALVLYLPIDNSLIAEIQDGLRDIAEKHHLKNELGFITPIDNGKRCVWEYDYYFDHNNPAEVSSIQQATYAAGILLDEYSVEPAQLGRFDMLLIRVAAEKKIYCIYSPKKAVLCSIKINQ